MLYLQVFSMLWAPLLGYAQVVLDSAPAIDTVRGNDILKYVDPLIGSTNGGHVFAGASLPYGMAKAVADVDGDKEAGFASDHSNVTGFSHMHDSGTGGSPSMGNFPLFPEVCGPDINNCIFPQNDRKTPYVNGSVVSEPGYFSIKLSTGIQADMTTTNHTALYRFTFPAAGNRSSSPLILADTIDLPLSRINATSSVDSDTGRITGSGTFVPSFGLGTYDLHFCADFEGAFIRDTGVFVNTRGGSQPKTVTTTPDGSDSGTSQNPVGTWVWFDQPSNGQILARVGVSFMSVDQACSNAEKEIPNFDFHKIRTAAREAWVEKLGVISILPGGASKSLLKVFWSGFYRSLLSPQDYTGENPLWKSTEPYWDSFYCIWDAFRAQLPLINILDPAAASEMVRSLIDTWRHEGYLPDCRMSLCKGFTQGGSNADVVLVDAYLKNITGVNWDDGYNAIMTDAVVEPNLWSVQGRGGLDSWNRLGYIPTDDFDPKGSSGGPFTRSISRTVEYAYNDFCIAEMAKSRGNVGDYEKYSQSSNNWKNMFNPDVESHGFHGFLAPRYLNETFGIQDPMLCSGLDDLSTGNCFLNPAGRETYEGSTWLYSFFAPGDMASVITAMGGPQTFVKRLQYFHDSGLLYIGDEQAFLPVFLYHYAGRPALSAVQSHAYIPRAFNTSHNGIPGNDDSGAMGSFAVLSMLGLFPNPGQNVYLITPPYFASISITNAQTGSTATIKNVNFDAEYKNIYIQSAKLNGEAYTKNWLDHGFFADGATLELTLGPEESSWGTREQDLPPSLSTSGGRL